MAAAGLILFLAACGPNNEADDTPAGSSSSAAAASAFPVSIENKFGTTTIPAEPKRIVTVGLVEQDALLALGVVPVGADSLRIEAGDAPLRAILLGGVPLGERIVMWWNFVGRSHEEVVAYREQWQRDVIDAADADGRFGHIDGWPAGSALPALPNVRLRPRD